MVKTIMRSLLIHNCTPQADKIAIQVLIRKHLPFDSQNCERGPVAGCDIGAWVSKLPFYLVRSPSTDGVIATLIKSCSLVLTALRTNA